MRSGATFGLVPQRFGLYQDLSIDENLDLRARLYDVPQAVAGPRATELLERVGLAPFRTRLAGALSGGMKQKLALAAALLTRPELLLLDEPTTGVDPLSRREFWRLLHELNHEGLTIVVSTPYMDEAEYASRLAFFDEGRLMGMGTRNDIVASFGRQLVEVRAVDRLAARARLRTLADVDDVSLFGTVLHVRATADAAPGFVDRVRGGPGRSRRSCAGQCHRAVAGGRVRAAQRTRRRVTARVSTLDGDSPKPISLRCATRGPQAMVAGNDPIVSVKGLTRRFGDFVAVDHVTFDIPRGRVLGFLGPNGSGKSTTIRMLTGLLAPTSGTIVGIGGLDATRDTERWKQRLGYMSQKFSLYLDLTVIENLRFFGAIYGLDRERVDARIAELSARLRFQPVLGAMTETLSTGQRQRVALAAALIHEPELLFLDEPTGGVDPRGRRMFWDLIYELAAERGMTVLVTTHYMDEAEQCDRLVLILNGRVIADGTPDAIKAGLAGRMLEVHRQRAVRRSERRHRTNRASTTRICSASRSAPWPPRGGSTTCACCSAATEPSRPPSPRSKTRSSRSSEGSRRCDGEDRGGGERDPGPTAGAPMKRLLALTRKEFRQLVRDHLTLRMIVMVPLMQMIIFGYAINFDVKHLSMVVLDESRSFESRELVAKMQASQYFDLIGSVDSFEEVRRALDTARRPVALVIDADFGRDQRQGSPAHAMLIVNASDSTTSSQAMSVAGGIANASRCRRWLSRRAGASASCPSICACGLGTTRTCVRPISSSRGFWPSILTFTLISFTAASIVRERELGTLEQLQVTPITRAQLILGKILPFLVIGYIQLTLVVVVMSLPLRHHDPGQPRRALPPQRALHRVRARTRHLHLHACEDADAGDADVDVHPAAVRVPIRVRVSDRRDARGVPVVDLPDSGEVLPADRARDRAARRVGGGVVAAHRVADLLHDRHHQPGDLPLQEDRSVSWDCPRLVAFRRVWDSPRNGRWMMRSQVDREKAQQIREYHAQWSVQVAETTTF